MAQERKKRRIVLASVLKPVDDTRMFGKMGASLTKSRDAEVYIIGYPASVEPRHDGIEFLPLTAFRRVSLQRLLAKWKVLMRLLKLKPTVLIFTTHELLLPAVILKIFMNVSIVYDVRENYFRNIIHSGSFHWLVKWPVAMLVRFKEKILAPSVDHFILAEKGYEKEIRFHRASWTVIENKAHFPVMNRSHRQGGLQLLFSGTLSESTGVFSAIELAKGLHNLDSSLSLTIVGHAALGHVLRQIHKEAEEHKFIRIIGGDRLVPHHEIITQIASASFGILSYPRLSHTKNSTPTKLFEYLCAGLPIILDSQWPWIEEYSDYRPFIFTDFQQPDYPALLEKMKSSATYPTRPQNVSWESEEPRFLTAMAKL